MNKKKMQSLSKRKFLGYVSAAAAVSGFPLEAFSSDYGRDLGFPSGWGPMGKTPNPWAYDDWIVGNFSGGIEQLFNKVVVKAPSEATFLADKPTPMRWSLFSSFQDYQRSNGKMGMLVARADSIYFENYEFERSKSMRFYSKSMAKSVLSLLTGFALEHGVLSNLEDTIDKYDARLKGKPLGAITIRQALNMSSGVDICHWLCGTPNNFERFELHGFLGHPKHRGKNTDQDAVIINWPYGFKSQPGTSFNYSHVDPQLISMAIRAATKMSIAQFMEMGLWKEIGAEADAVWLTDAAGAEDVSSSLLACMRDWGRLGLLVAQNGFIGSRQVISDSWFHECRTLRTDEGFLRKGKIAGYDQGYKFYFHHPRDDGAWLRFGGDLGQSIYTDSKSGTCLVILSASNRGGQDYRGLFETSISTASRK